MGIRLKFFFVVLAMAVGVGAAGYFTLGHSHDRLIQQEAARIAEIVSTQVVNDRAEYTANVVGKLKKEGTGAAIDSSQRPGYVQLPAQFVRNVSQRVKEVAGRLYSYSLVSQWNLNAEQGLRDDFDRWAWGQMLDQDEENRRVGRIPGPNGHEWKSAYRVETVKGKLLLRYMKADPAAAEACVTCHNQYELRPDVRRQRTAAGVPPGKSWKLHDLMGALRVEVPMDEVAEAAAVGTNNALAGLGAVLLAGFGFLYFLISSTIIKPIEQSIKAVEGFKEKVDSVVDCSKQNVLAAEDQSDDYATAKSKVAAAAERTPGPELEAVSASLTKLADASEENAMRAEESSVYCNDLDRSFNELKGRFQKMLGQKVESF